VSCLSPPGTCGTSLADINHQQAAEKPIRTARFYGLHGLKKPGLSGYLVSLVGLVQPNQPDKQNKPEKPNEQEEEAAWSWQLKVEISI
jgi:hypothetical protein